jgi:hypothetical protein
MNSLSELQSYKFRGARALLLVHEAALRKLLDTWRQAKAAGITLPVSKNPNYQSLDHLLRHTLNAPGALMGWICSKLELPDPEISEPPAVEKIEAEADWYLIYLLGKLREPLVDVETARFTDRTYDTSRKIPYTIESMLEHIVLHTLKHDFQLQELLAAHKST